MAAPVREAHTARPAWAGERSANYWARQCKLLMSCLASERIEPKVSAANGWKTHPEGSQSSFPLRALVVAAVSMNMILFYIIICNIIIELRLKYKNIYAYKQMIMHT